VRPLVGLANGLLTLWEQARGRRRHRAGLPGQTHCDGSRCAPDGPVATVVLLNWQRPANVRIILDAYTRYRRVAEIIVWNNNPNLTFTYGEAKVRSVNSGELGLSTRWAAALLASHACVIVADDDLIADEDTIDRLIEWCRRDPDRVYTLHGRNPTPDNEYAVHVDHVRQPTEAVMHLTRLACLDRRHVPHYFLALEELGLRIDPATGGGEDIVMSFALARATGKRPLVVPGSYRDLLAPGGIANRYGSQRQHRTFIMRRCQAWLDDAARAQRDSRTNP
jgi:Glycosyl transferase family 64 domain